MDENFSWKVRGDFPMLAEKMHEKPLIYLDSAATMLKPKQVIDTTVEYYTHSYGTVHRAVYALAATATARYDQVRESIRSFIGAEHVDEILFTKGTTEGINLVAATFGDALLCEGDEILLAETEHHSNIVPWQLLCKRKKAVIKVIPVNDRGEILLEELDKLLSSKTKIVGLAHVANVTGTVHPIEEVIKKAHACGAYVLVDGAQSIAHMPVDVKELDVDFYVFSGHKAFGPTGVGVLYGKRDLLEKMPPYQGGGDMIEKVSFAETTFQKAPLRFEAGTPMIAEVLGLGSAIDYINSLGRENILHWEKKLLSYATAKLLSLPQVKIIGTALHKASIISFSCKGIHPLDIGTLLDTKGIAVRTGHLCSQPTMQRFGVSSLTRVSFGVYNTFEEIDLFIEALQKILLRVSP